MELQEKEKNECRVLSYVPKSVYKALELMALRENTSLSSIIRECLLLGIETKGESQQ